MFNYLKIIFSFKKQVSTLPATHIPHHIKQLTIYESPQGPQSHNLMTEGGGGSEWFFWDWNFGQKWSFWVYERCWDFFGSW